MASEVDRDAGGAQTSLDSVLDRLARVISDRTGATPAADDGAEPDNDQPVPAPAVGADALELREWFGREHRFFEALPPLTLKAADEIDRVLERLPEVIKSLSNRPGFRERLRSAAVGGRGASVERTADTPLPAPIATLITRAAAEAEAARSRQERGVDEVPEAISSYIEMLRSHLGDSDERIIPVAAVLIFYAVGSMAGGATIGYMVTKAVKNTID